VIGSLVGAMWVGDARGGDTPTTTDSETSGTGQRDVRSEVPILAYSYSAYGATAGTVGAEGYGLGLAASGQKGALGGGITAWGSPIDRLTLIGDGARDIFGNFAPSAAAVVRLLGKPGDGWSLGGLGKFKIEGFGVGPKNEIESEVELGALLSYARSGWHLDLNGIGGRGTGDDGDSDIEGRLRLGRDLGSLFRIGADGQARYRVAGAAKLLGNRDWDFAAGPQLMIGRGHVFGALTGGPATMAVAQGVGWTVVATVGGTTF
jgi:hypothetical protein